MQAGWIHIRGEKTAYTNYYKKMKDAELAEWPPKFWKFHLATAENPSVEIAYTDARRFGRVRLVDCPGPEIRQHSPLKENGPDPVVDIDRFTEDYLRSKMKTRHVPVKALLLDQATISGIGNWVADETLYHAKLHPEQYSDTFSDAEITKLYESVRYVCQTAVDKLGDSDEFPKHWIFDYRWGKGAKGAADKLPNGERLAFITVGGRTSCYAPAVQKKTGQVVEGAKADFVEPEPASTPPPPAGGKKKSRKAGSDVKVEVQESNEAEAAPLMKSEPTSKKRKQRVSRAKEEDDDDNAEDGRPPLKKSQRSSTVKEEKVDSKAESSGRRRSSRLQR